MLLLKGVLSHSSEPRIAHRSSTLTITKRGNKAAITSNKRKSISRFLMRQDHHHIKAFFSIKRCPNRRINIPFRRWNTTKQPPQPQQHPKPKTTHTKPSQATMAAYESQVPKSTLLPSLNQSRSHSPAAQPKIASSKLL
jgi:hypothetical protein